MSYPPEHVNLSTNRVYHSEIIEAVNLISNSDRVKFFTGADFKALLSSAYLSAVHERIQNKSTSESIRSVDELVQAKHLLRSLDESKPSMAVSDLTFYDRIFRRFRGDAGVCGPQINSKTAGESSISLVGEERATLK